MSMIALLFTHNYGALQSGSKLNSCLSANPASVHPQRMDSNMYTHIHAHMHTQLNKYKV